MSEVQLYIISVLASVIVWGIKEYRKRAGKDVPNAVLTIGVFVFSLGLSIAWTSGTILPPLPVCVADDPGGCVTGYLNYIDELVKVAGGYVVFAIVVYQALLKAVLSVHIPTLIKRTRRALGKG